MFHNHLKQGFRLSRTIGLALLGYELILLASVKLSTTVAPNDIPWLSARLLSMAVITGLFLILNEVSLRAFKRHPRLDEITLEKLSLLLPLGGGVLIALSYLASGQLGILLLGGVISLQSQLFGHNGIARTFMLLFGLLYLITLPLGYPLILGFKPDALTMIPTNIKLFMMLLPLMATISHFGNIIASTQRNTSSRVSRLQSLAATDGLTGLINRRQFNQQLDAEIARAKRYRKPLSLALFDIDDFKKINDFYGHTTGDRILKELGALITQNVRESDVAARYGGEEFALILPETGQIDAYELLERLRAMIERTVYCLPDNPITATISVGVAQLDLDEAKGYEIIEKADTNLYAAKRQGKNQVVYGTLTPPKVNYPPFGPE
ncbi:GGDEF domain-containing protein [Vampirovibrio sp.]|uniref:GGDEF domain-containing protein n=1 Tax=Vampirovibrio sp. TaxID=2717857 RepID=UPI0035935BB0